MIYSGGGYRKHSPEQGTLVLCFAEKASVFYKDKEGKNKQQQKIIKENFLIIGLYLFVCFMYE